MLLAVPTVVSAGEGEGVPSSDFVLGAQTHFSQGWDIGLMPRLKDLGAVTFRDGIYWGKVEVSAGKYDLSSAEPYLSEAGKLGLEPLLVFAGWHRDYDDASTPNSDAGRKAFAAYVANAVRTYPETVRRMEVGNEYNTNSFLKGPFRDAREQYYALLIKEVAQAVHAANPSVEIICTGAHSVATGYFRGVFENGGLEYCDAISFHPYRDFPENLDRDVERLRALMREFGGEKPLYVTEFGKWFEDRAEAPDFMLKMVSILGAQGVRRAYWYALKEQEWWPNMGLIDEDGSEMPGAKAFRFLQDTLLPLGRPDSASDDRLTRMYDFGASKKAIVIWGVPGRLVVSGDNVAYFDASGQSLSKVDVLSSSPVVILGENLDVSVEREGTFYDVFYQYGDAPWSYIAQKPDGTSVPFEIIDSNWDPYLGHKDLAPMAVRPMGVAAANFRGRPYYAVERFTVPSPGTYVVKGRWWRKETAWDGADVKLSLNGQVLAKGLVNKESFEFGPTELELDRGDILDFAVGPNIIPGGDGVFRSIEIHGF